MTFWSSTFPFHSPRAFSRSSVDWPAVSKVKSSPLACCQRPQDGMVCDWLVAPEACLAVCDGLSILVRLCRISTFTCSGGIPRGRARSGDFRPPGIQCNFVTTKRCSRLLLRSELDRACPEATQRSRFLAVPRYERFRCSRICAAPHLPSGWRDRSSGDIP